MGGTARRCLPTREKAIAELGGQRDLRIDVRPPEALESAQSHGRGHPADASDLQARRQGGKRARRTATLCVRSARDTRSVALDGEVSNSTHATSSRTLPGQVLRDVHRRAGDGRERGRFSRFADTSPSPRRLQAFLSRAYDFVRMAGVSPGGSPPLRIPRRLRDRRGRPITDGARDIASLRAVHTSTVLYPSDAVSAAKLVAQMVDLTGISYVRTTRRCIPRPVCER